MKKVLLLLLVLLLSISTFACSKDETEDKKIKDDKPVDVAKDFMKAIHNEDANDFLDTLTDDVIDEIKDEAYNMDMKLEDYISFTLEGLNEGLTSQYGDNWLRVVDYEPTYLST